MKKWKIALIGMMSISLTACWKSSYEFEGKYFLAEGDECTIPSSPRDRDQYFLEITYQAQDGAKRYTAKLPIASMMGAPISSNESSSPADNNELTFKFSKDEKSGFFSGTPGVDIVISVIPNETKKDYIWIKKFDTTIVQEGKIKEFSMVDSLRETKKVGSKGICLRKLLT